MPAIDHFDGHANLTRGQRRGNAPILAELLGSPTRIRHADAFTTVAPEHQDGSQGTPYSTVQAAVDDLIANVDDYTPRGVVVHGVCDEAVIVDAHNIALLGADGKWMSTLVQVDGVALTVTNATRESLATYRSSGLYSDLEWNGRLVHNFFCYDLRIDRDGAYTTNAVELLGVKGDVDADTSGFLSADPVGPYGSRYKIGGYFINNVVFRGFFMKNAGFCNLYDTEVGFLVMENCTYPGLYYFETLVDQPCSIDYETSHADGEPKYGNYGLFIGGYCRTYQVFQVLHEANVGWDGWPYAMWVGTDLDLRGTSHVYLANGYVEGDVLAEGTAQFDFDNNHVKGDVTLAAGAGACVMRGGRIMGTVGGAGSARLTHTQGNIGT
jgi:hypothetical protein